MLEKLRQLIILIVLIVLSEFPSKNMPSSQVKTCQVPKRKHAKFPSENAPSSQVKTRQVPK